METLRAVTILLVISVFVKAWKIGRIIYRSDHSWGKDIAFNQTTSYSQQGMLQNSDIFTKISADQQWDLWPKLPFDVCQMACLQEAVSGLFSINIHGNYPCCKKNPDKNVALPVIPYQNVILNNVYFPIESWGWILKNRVWPCPQLQFWSCHDRKAKQLCKLNQRESATLLLPVKMSLYLC